MTDFEPTRDPSDAAKLEQAEEYFRLGDYARMTSALRGLSKSDDPAIVGAADALRQRLSTPPLTKYLLGLTFLLLLASTWFAFAQ